MMEHVKGVIAASPAGTKIGAFTLKVADDFSYTDPIDGSVAKGQGLRCGAREAPGGGVVVGWRCRCCS